MVVVAYANDIVMALQRQEDGERMWRERALVLFRENQRWMRENLAGFLGASINCGAANAKLLKS